MKNTVPTNQTGVLAYAFALYKGALEHGITIGLVHVTATIMLGLRSAAVTARDLFEAGKLLLSDRRIALGEAMDTARVFAALARDILKPTFGNEYSQRWDVTGFVGKLEIPRTAEEMLVLLEALKGFFTANPTLEMGSVTATQAQAMFDALSAAKSAFDSQETTYDSLMADRDAKFAALRKGIRDMISELETLIDPMDARWLAFGLNKPGADETPDVVTNVASILIGPTAVALKWPAPARAVYYHVYKRVHGVDTELVLAGSPADLDFTLEDLPNNVDVDIAVAAVNNGGEGPMSEMITIKTH